MPAGKESAELRRILVILPFAETDRADWEAAGESLAKLRPDGVSLPLTDALIATIARRRSMEILTLDAHFRRPAVPLHSVD